MWRHVTTLPDDKKGAAMGMSLTGVASTTSRSVKVDALLTPGGHIKLLDVLRVDYGGSEAVRGLDCYRKLTALRCGNWTMEE
eukprot:contig_25292_g6234